MMQNKSKNKGIAIAKLNVRSGPGIYYKKLYTLDICEKIENILSVVYDTYGNKWYRINSYNTKEYVLAKYVFTI